MRWSTEDWHTAGEPFRIVEDVATEGSTVAGLPSSATRVRRKWHVVCAV